MLATCESDGRWSPDPTTYACVSGKVESLQTVISPTLSEVTCGSPVTPSRGSVDVIGGAPPFPLGSEVTYRCDEELFPAGVMASTCQSVGGVGTWRPNTSIICRNMPGEHAVMPLAI